MDMFKPNFCHLMPPECIFSSIYSFEQLNIVKISLIQNDFLKYNK